MRRSRRCALVGALVVLLTGATAAGAGAQASGGPLQGTDVGITPTTIRIGVLADVDNAAEPGLFQGSVGTRCRDGPGT